MQVFTETLDPSETKDFTYDWSPRLGDGETVSSQVVTFIQTGGTTSPSASVASPVSRVWLSGGTHGSRAIFTILATTSGGRTIEAALAVDVVDNVAGPISETESARLTRLITEAEAQRHKVALGEAIIEVWRDGRRIQKTFATMAELDSYISALRSELVAAQIAEGVTPTRKRRAIGLAWRN